ncbi:hypothetical protein FQN57_004119 [Myotisia sp. PD_48]|nr:hypothetical protein FQN57_004119 [Myotisia sp. PD_48]
MGFWRDTGTGISSRHAEYCLKRFDYLKSDADLPSLRSPALKERIKDPNLILTAVTTATAERLDIEMLIAKLASSDKPGQRPVTSNDVFLYPNGMAAIYAVIRAIEALDSEGGVAIYGWLYSESLKLIKRGAWSNLLYYGWGSKKELDELEGTLAGGTHIKALLCELPGNPLLNSVDLHRLRALADKYHFLIVCDETVGTFVNTDLLPYVDLLVTSLTKMFSGGCDVMGGSVVVNPQSIDRDAIHGKLKEQYEDTYFPGDIGTMQYNSIDFVQRVYRSNKSAVSIAQLLANHSSVKELHYPLFGPTVHLYERYRRLNGGYGHLMSIVFHKPQSAECFYDALNVCKGSSFGTNFTLAIPYVQLAHFHEQDWAESYGVAKHIIRLSVGLEKQDLLMKVMLQALTAVEILEQSSRGGENPKM